MGDFIEYDFANRTNRVGKVDGLFVHELLGVRRLFARVSEAEYEAGSVDLMLKPPILRLTGGTTLIGLPRIHSKSLYIVQVEDTLVMVDWVSVQFL